MKTAEFFRNRKVRRAAVVLACIVLVYGGLRLYGWAEPRIYYASLDRQEWREDMEPGDLVQLSFDGQRFSHTPVVVAADHPKRLSDVLVAAHSYDRDYWPLSRYEFTDIRFLHIIGVNRPVF